IKGVHVRRLVIEPRAHLAERRGMSFRPQVLTTGLFIEAIVYVDLPLRGSVTVHFTSMGNFEIRTRQSDGMRRLFLTLADPVFHSISSTGVIGRRNEDTVRDEIQAGLAFDVTDHVGTDLTAALAAGVALPRIVPTYDAVHLVLAESGADRGYAALDSLQ